LIYHLAGVIIFGLLVGCGQRRVLPHVAR